MISEEERKKYVEFMYNPENEYNCDECPENKDFDDWEGKISLRATKLLGYLSLQRNYGINTRCKLCVRLR